MNWMHWMNWYDGGWLMMLLWWVVFLLGIVVLAKWLGTQKPYTKDRDTALEILRKRYASGEITKREFDTIKEDLVS